MKIRLAEPMIGPEEEEAVLRVMRSGHLAQGPEVAEFEAEFSELVGSRQCVAVNSGTSALHLAVIAAGVGPGDEVIVPSFTFAATANAVRLAGAMPVFGDIQSGDFNLDAAEVERLITPRTKAVIPVHLYGHPAPMPELCEAARRHGAVVIEDAAQAHGATIAGRPVGTWGDLAIFSFYPTKNMTTGEGGMVVTEDPGHVRLLRLLRNQGMERRYENEIVGFNLRLTDIAAAIGRVQLRRLREWNSIRRSHAAIFDSELMGVVVPPVSDGAEHVYHQYTVRSDHRDALSRHLTERGVESAVYYPRPVHRLPAFDSQANLPETERAADEVLSLPVGPHLTDQEIRQVVDAVNSFSESSGLSP